MKVEAGDYFKETDVRKIAVEDAVGMALCHDITQMKDGFKGPAFKRDILFRARLIV